MTRELVKHKQTQNTASAVHNAEGGGPGSAGSQNCSGRLLGGWVSGRRQTPPPSVMTQSGCPNFNLSFHAAFAFCSHFAYTFGNFAFVLSSTLVVITLGGGGCWVISSEDCWQKLCWRWVGGSWARARPPSSVALNYDVPCHVQ